MSPSARAAAVTAFFALLVLGILLGDDARVLGRTSFGKVPAGYGALFDLLGELGLPVARSFAAVDTMPPGATVWWIEPVGLAKAEPAPDAEPPARERPASPLRGAALAAFVERGGTAVVLLPARAGDAIPSVDALAGAAVPERRAIERDGGEDGAKDDAPAEPIEAEVVLPGAVASLARTLVLDAPVVFRTDGEALADYRVAAWLDGEPFLLERAIGAGRLVIGADARFATNQWLDRGDAALLAVDLVRRWGTPRIDEHEHGMTTQRGTLAYLAQSPALAFFGGLALLALAIAWNGAALPRRTLADATAGAPTLESFVASMARLYAATGDHPRVLERARELAARRLRRHFGLPPDAPVERLIERLARRQRLPSEGFSVLSHGAPVRDAADLEHAVATLDGFVEEAVS